MQYCKIPGCSRLADLSGVCPKHAVRRRLGGRPTEVQRDRTKYSRKRKHRGEEST